MHLLKRILLLLLSHHSRGMDGCKGLFARSDGVDVDFGERYWKCGDVCTHYESECFCGNETLKYDDGRWCCGSQCTSGSCLRWKEKKEKINGEWVGTGELHKEGDEPYYCIEWAPAVCTTGVLLNLTETCNKICNEHPQDKYRDYFSPRSHVFACRAADSCIKEGEVNFDGIKDSTGEDKEYKPTICTGDSSCDGELTWCKQEERKNETCPNIVGLGKKFTRCLPILRGGENNTTHDRVNGIPGQCYHKQKSKDGIIYHCLDRTDEDPFQREGSGTNEPKINLNELNKCTDKNGDAGFHCGETGNWDDCVAFIYWCSGDFSPSECPALGANILTNNPRVCQNISIWRDKSCGDEYLIRCRASKSGECTTKGSWGVERNHYGCKDGSDLYRPIVNRAGHRLFAVNSGHSVDEELIKAKENNGPIDNSNKGQPGGSIDNSHSYLDDYDLLKQSKESREKYKQSSTVSCGNHQAENCAACAQVNESAQKKFSLKGSLSL